MVHNRSRYSHIQVEPAAFGAAPNVLPAEQNQRGLLGSKLECAGFSGSLSPAFKFLVQLATVPSAP